MAKGSHSRKGWIIGSVVAGVLLLGGGAAAFTASSWTGGTGTGASESSTSASASPSKPAVPKPVAVVTPDAGAVEVNPVTAPVITVSEGTVKSAVLAPESGGEPVPGELSAGGTVWTASGKLAFNTAYALKYTLADANGDTSTETRKFTTVSEANEANAFMYPASGSTVGTGQPIELSFSEPVLNKPAVEAAITVTSTSGQVGAFYWISDTKVRYRAEEFWAPNSTVTVDMQLFGVDFGNGMIGNFNETASFTTHNTRLAVVDNADKMMRVYIDGVLTRTFPVTLGTQDWPSTIGYHVIMDQHETIPFRAESIGLKPGDKDYYEPVTAKNASRLSQGGAFIHEALPAAQSILGVMNVSHGCIGMSPEGAKYMYDNFDAGDVVQVLNTGYGPMFVWDGFGDWNVPWAEWVSQPKQ
ncbi:L,D-transpeptidase family protein [Arthrobacter jiangjiafuii]|uniref:L,D-transpeptidase family protein n=1 Tax=Arthrobacter jiangjiafuii TaxID=2817475 RepID=A0A975M6Y0_9MICC|nr:Ig-like domain-containing protein [Arthrobacter jiangjiafuii]MBP3043937.1 L,D-transpeptidase family protein [Arthrobacter jiangjiafuii]QWC10935.1 L,D-transpeptidase family protein [Arthrobacter jiangjiafuii]